MRLQRTSSQQAANQILPFSRGQQPIKHPLPTPFIFVADDDEDDRYLLGKAFEQHSPKCQLHFAYDGQDLVDALALSQVVPHLIVLDLNMPRLDGFEALQTLRQNTRYRLTPIVMLTTSEAVQDRQRAFELGANDFITKPFTTGLLGQAVHKLRTDWLVGKCTC